MANYPLRMTGATGRFTTQPPPGVPLRGISQRARMGRKANTIPVQTINVTTPGPIIPTQSVQFTTESGGGDAQILGTVVVAEYDSGRTETVYDGTSFTTDYATSSTRVENPDGTITYSVIRDGDWPEDVDVEIVSFDDEGNRATDSYSYSVTGGTGFAETHRLDPLLIRGSP